MGSHCIDEGLIYADDLAGTDPDGMAVLKRYVEEHPAGTERDRPIRLLSRSQFVDKVFYPGRLSGTGPSGRVQPPLRPVPDWPSGPPRPGGRTLAGFR